MDVVEAEGEVEGAEWICEGETTGVVGWELGPELESCV